MNPIRWSRRFATAVVSTLVGISCGEPDSVVSWVIPLDPVATSEAPLSDEGEIALAAETTACVIESYEYRVHCINRDDGSVNVFGRAGEGPGEFRDLTHVVRGSGGTIGVIDYALDRLTVFEPSGKRVSEARIPSGINPGVSLGHRLMGQRLELESISFRHLELDIASGKMTWQRIFPYRLAAEAGCKPGEGRPLPEGSVPRLPPSLGRGYMFPNHAMLFPGLCRGQMLYLARSGRRYQYRDSGADIHCGTPISQRCRAILGKLRPRPVCLPRDPEHVSPTVLRRGIPADAEAIFGQRPSRDRRSRQTLDPHQPRSQRVFVPRRLCGSRVRRNGPCASPGGKV